jgi:hypothetical protein
VKHIKTGSKRGAFDVVLSTRLAEVAKMTPRPGAASDSQPSNEHAKSEQWLLVISGSGEAVVCRGSSALRPPARCH